MSDRKTSTSSGIEGRRSHRRSDQQSGQDQAGRLRQAARRIQADSTSVRLASNVLENPVMMQPSKSRSIKWTCLQPWGPIMMVEAAVARAGKCGSHAQDRHGYNYVWHEVMGGLRERSPDRAAVSAPKHRQRQQHGCLGGRDRAEIGPWSEKVENKLKKKKTQSGQQSKAHKLQQRQSHRLHIVSHHDPEHDVRRAAAVSQLPVP